MLAGSPLMLVEAINSFPVTIYFLVWKTYLYTVAKVKYVHCVHAKACNVNWLQTIWEEPEVGR